MGDFFRMVLVAICSSLIGAVLGTRFKVLILYPAITVGITLVTAIAALRGSAMSTAIGVAVTLGIFLQLGYLGGVVMHLCLTLTRPLYPRSPRVVRN
jgi:hypothetical protein